MQAVLKHASGTELVFAIDSNARSTTWHDVLTNKRDKSLEEFLIANHLHIANEESCNTTFQTYRRASNIDLTIFNNSATKYLQGWVVYDRESCSYHNIIQYALGDELFQLTESNNSGKRYKVTQENMGKFLAKILQTLEHKSKGTGTEDKEVDRLEEILCQGVIRTPNIEAAVEELQEVLQQACRSSLTQMGTIGKALRHKPIPWWNQTLQPRERK